MTTTPADLDRLARKRAKAKMGWFIHAFVYVMVNLALVAHSLHAGRGWAIFPLAGWGIGLLAHGLSVWGLRGTLDRMTERERTRLQDRAGAC
jgi:uncharacterized membrane protein